MRTVSADACQLKTPYVKSVCFDLCKYHNGTSIRMSWGTGSLRVASQGLSRAFLKTFAAVLPDPTDRPWVSEDANLLVSRQTFVINTKPNKYHDSYLSCTHSELRKSNTYELLKIVQNLFLRHKTQIETLWAINLIYWRWSLSLGQVYARDTSIHGTPNSVPEKCSHNLCIYYPSIERTRLFRGKGQFFWARKPGFNLDSGDTLALKKWLTTKRVDIFELMYSTHNYESFHKVNFLTWIEVMHLCEFSI